MAWAEPHLLVERNPGEWRLALIEGGRLEGLVIARDHEPQRMGDILLGRVRAHVAAIRASFVAIGDAEDGFLPWQDARWLRPDRDAERVPETLPEGTAILVQVTRDAEGTKGARLTADISLDGRLLVWLPRGDGIRASKRLGDDTGQRRLTEFLAGLGMGGGFVLRTAAEGADTAELDREARTLARDWAEIEARAAHATAPALVARRGGGLAGALAAIGWNAGDRVTVDSDATAAALLAIEPEAAPEICRAADGPLEMEGAAVEIDALLGSDVPLPGGGRLIIEQTAALTAIDVDSGTASGTAARASVNLAAAREIPRQLSLRNIGGVAIADFILDRDRTPGEAVLRALRQGFEADPARPHLAGVTPSGLVEIVRRRTGPSLADRLLGAPGRRPTAETDALAALAEIRRLLRAEPGFRPALRLPRAGALALSGPLAPALQELEAALHSPLPVSADAALDRGWIIERKQG